MVKAKKKAQKQGQAPVGNVQTRAQMAANRQDRSQTRSPSSHDPTQTNRSATVPTNTTTRQRSPTPAGSSSGSDSGSRSGRRRGRKKQGQTSQSQSMQGDLAAIFQQLQLILDRVTQHDINIADISQRLTAVTTAVTLSRQGPNINLQATTSGTTTSTSANANIQMSTTNVPYMHQPCSLGQFTSLAYSHLAPIVTPFTTTVTTATTPTLNQNLAMGITTNIPGISGTTSNRPSKPKQWKNFVKFDGSNWDHFYNAFKFEAEECGWDEEYKKQMMYSRLIEEATEVTKTVDITTITFDDFVEVLRKSYAREDRYADFRHQFHNTKRRPGQNYSLFANHLRYLCKKAHPNFSEQSINDLVYEQLWYYASQFDKAIYERFSITNARSVDDIIREGDRWLCDHPEPIREECQIKQNSSRQGIRQIAQMDSQRLSVVDAGPDTELESVQPKYWKQRNGQFGRFRPIPNDNREYPFGNSWRSDNEYQRPRSNFRSNFRHGGFQQSRPHHYEQPRMQRTSNYSRASPSYERRLYEQRRIPMVDPAIRMNNPSRSYANAMKEGRIQSTNDDGQRQLNGANLRSPRAQRPFKRTQWYNRDRYNTKPLAQYDMQPEDKFNPRETEDEEYVPFETRPAYFYNQNDGRTSCQITTQSLNSRDPRQVSWYQSPVGGY
jgi:hypothetical protein